MKINVNEIFGPTIQGEGLYCGTPTFFIRLNGCNLRCAFAGGSICDTAYTSHHPERVASKPVEEVAQELLDLYKANDKVTHLVVTGGEPMLQQKSLFDLLKLVLAELPLLQVTIETNGSIMPRECWKEIADSVYWSVSPKLANSCCFEGTDVPLHEQNFHNLNRINYEAVQYMQELGRGQLKFVFSADDQTEGYIWNYLLNLGGTDWPVMIMPEGQTQSQITKSAIACVDAAVRNGWRVADRLHIRIWGDKRGV